LLAFAIALSDINSKASFDLQLAILMRTFYSLCLGNDSKPL